MQQWEMLSLHLVRLCLISCAQLTVLISRDDAKLRKLTHSTSLFLLSVKLLVYITTSIAYSITNMQCLLPVNNIDCLVRQQASA